MKTNFKRVIISLMAVVTISALFSACGNVQTSDKNVETSATTTSSVSGAITTSTPSISDNIDWSVTTIEGQTFAVTNTETIVYKGENTESGQITTLPKGTQIIVDTTESDSEFVSITTTTGERGYISTSTYKDIDEGYTTDHGSFEIVHKGTTTTAPANTSAPTTTTVVATKPVTTTTVTTKAPTVMTTEKKTTTTSATKKNTTTTKKKVTTTTTTKKNTVTTSSNKKNKLCCF